MSTKNEYCTHYPTDSDLSSLCMKLRAHDEEVWSNETQDHRNIVDMIRELREHPNVKSVEVVLKV